MSSYDLLVKNSVQIGKIETVYIPKGTKEDRYHQWGVLTSIVQNSQSTRNHNNNSNGEYLVPRTGRHKIPVLDCYKCVKPAHMYFNCNEPDHRRNSTVNIFQMGYIFKKHNNKDIL